MVSNLLAALHGVLYKIGQRFVFGQTDCAKRSENLCFEIRTTVCRVFLRFLTVVKKDCIPKEKSILFDLFKAFD